MSAQSTPEAVDVRQKSDGPPLARITSSFFGKLQVQHLLNGCWPVSTLLDHLKEVGEVLYSEVW
eukprot:3268095-Amphidinium_carterae.1